jgi:cell division protein ZapA
MAETPKTLDVNILGRSYKVACGDGEREGLLQAVAYVDGKMGEIKSAGKIAGNERIAVMVALNIAHELLSTKIGGGFDLGQAKRAFSRAIRKLRPLLCSTGLKFPNR